MASKDSAPAGATVVKEEKVDEFQARKAAGKGKGRSMEDFIQAKKEEEERMRGGTSSDLEVLKNVTPDQLLKLQGIDKKGRLTGEPARLYGWSPKTKTACVLKMVFLEERDKRKK